MIWKLILFLLRRRDWKKNIIPIIGKAFEDNRFVVLISIRNCIDRVCFTPRYDEQDLFLTMYVIPFLNGSFGGFHWMGWWRGVGSRAEKSWGIFYRWSDVEQVTFFASDITHIDRLIQRAYELMNRKEQ